MSVSCSFSWVDVNNRSHRAFKWVIRIGRLGLPWRWRSSSVKGWCFSLAVALMPENHVARSYW